MRLWLASTIVLLLAASAVAGEAAPPAGVVTGVVKDALERPLPRARVRLETTDGRVAGRTTADDQGRFSFTPVAPGTYAVVAEQPGFEPATAIVILTEAELVSADLALASQRPLDLQVAAKRLEEERIKIQPRVGASTYEFSNKAIESQPGGENNPLPRVLLQAPGVTQDSSSAGGIHVREQMGNVQYRINGIVLPEGATLFAQSGGLSPRLASSITLLTGALPAEYGLRTTGIFDIQTKTGAFEPGGHVGVYGGSHAWLQPSAEYRGAIGRFNYFLTGDYLQNSIGISPATPNGAIHDDTRQGHGFGYFEYLLDATSKVSAIAGSFVGHFQIPNRPDVSPSFTVNGISEFDSRKIDETQREQNHFLVLSYLKTAGDFSVQATSSVLPAVDGVPTSDQPFKIFDSRGKTGYTYSVYLQDAWRILPTVTINGGLRLDGLEAFTSEWQLSPRLNVVWEATPTTTIHAGYARYFTPPRQEFVATGSVARFANTTAEASVPVNAPVRAERAHYIDAGVTQQILPGLKVGLDAYYKQSLYHLDEGQFGAPTFLTPFNYHHATNIGIELTTSYTAGGFSAYGNLAAAQQVAKGIVSAQALFDAEDLAYIHQHYIVTDHSQLITASAGLSYLWRQTRVSLDLLVGSGLRRTVRYPNDATNPPYQQLDFGIAQRFTLPAIGAMEARFDVINVLGQNYVLRDGTGVGIFARQFGPPRGFFAGVKKEF